MTVIDNIEDRPCHFPLALIIRVHPDLHLSLTDRHEAHCQTRTYPCETTQQEGNEGVDVEERRGGRDEWFVVAGLESVGNEDDGECGSKAEHQNIMDSITIQ